MNAFEYCPALSSPLGTFFTFAIGALFGVGFERIRSRLKVKSAATDSNQAPEDPVVTRVQSLSDQLHRLNDALIKKSEDEAQLKSSIKTHLDHILSVSQAVGERTLSLEEVLKGNVRAQGAWGELVLERVLEASGLEKERDYHVQYSLTDEDGGRSRPDVVINLPGGRSLIIDSKVSLGSVFDLQNQFSSAGATAHDSTHDVVAKNLRRHIAALASKDYALKWNQAGEGKAPELIFLFIPLESILRHALDADPQLIEDAFEKNIALVTPITLLSALKITAQLWRHERQAENTAEIVAVATQLYERIQSVVEDLDRAGQKLEDAKKSVDAVSQKITSGKSGLNSSAKRLRELGIQSSY